MEDIKTFLVQALHDKENSRPRSTQVQIGPSELGGCRRRVWYRLNNQPETNEQELKLAAIMGTAIHGAYRNLSYFPSQQQRWQVQVYGYLIEKSGKGKVSRVNLVAIPRDGDERDIKVHSEAYDEKVALEALSWLEAIKASDVAPEPERDESYCKFYCKYYDASGEMGCVGLKKGRTKTEQPPIDNPEVDLRALEYLQLDKEITRLVAKKEALRDVFAGLTGLTQSGIDIRWSTVQNNTVDKEAVEKALGFVPTKQGKESARLSIKLITGGI